MSPVTTGVRWKLDDVWHLECDRHGFIPCTHTYDYLTRPIGGGEGVDLPSGTAVRLQLAGEFPNPIAAAGPAAPLTMEKFGSFDVDVSDKINSYGTRKIKLITPGENYFIMMLNPEDAIVSIYEAVVEFVKTQVFYSDEVKFASCKGPTHNFRMQNDLAKLERFIETYPMLEVWDLLSKLTTNSCIACMWKRSVNAAPDAGASGLGNL